MMWSRRERKCGASVSGSDGISVVARSSAARAAAGWPDNAIASASTSGLGRIGQQFEDLRRRRPCMLCHVDLRQHADRADEHHIGQVLLARALRDQHPGAVRHVFQGLVGALLRQQHGAERDADLGHGGMFRPHLRDGGCQRLAQRAFGLGRIGFARQRGDLRQRDAAARRIDAMAGLDQWLDLFQQCQRFLATAAGDVHVGQRRIRHHLRGGAFLAVLRNQRYRAFQIAFGSLQVAVAHVRGTALHQCLGQVAA